MKLKFLLFLFVLALTFPVMALGETKEVRLGGSVYTGYNFIGEKISQVMIT
ncbi:hypothetical protein H6777_03540 [Candidatus Nomurabacteria bacterium]|nr:hypothetical protein [Candidatus Nomurabacteria bacterium]